MFLFLGISIGLHGRATQDDRILSMYQWMFMVMQDWAFMDWEMVEKYCMNNQHNTSCNTYVGVYQYFGELHGT